MLPAVVTKRGIEPPSYRKPIDLEGVEARAGNPTVATKLLTIKDLQSPDFGVLYHSYVSKRAEFGKCRVFKPLAAPVWQW